MKCFQVCAREPGSFSSSAHFFPSLLHSLFFSMDPPYKKGVLHPEIMHTQCKEHEKGRRCIIYANDKWCKVCLVDLLTVLPRQFLLACDDLDKAAVELGVHKDELSKAEDRIQELEVINDSHKAMAAFLENKVKEVSRKWNEDRKAIQRLKWTVDEINKELAAAKEAIDKGFYKHNSPIFYMSTIPTLKEKINKLQQENQKLEREKQRLLCEGNGKENNGFENVGGGAAVISPPAVTQPPLKKHKH